jgi:hypothetical protein
LIAAGIVAVFFGAGFLLLLRTADGTVSTSADRADPKIVSLPPALSRALTDTSAVPVNAPVPAPNSPAETAPAPPTLGLSKTEIAELLEHGDALLRNGDVASARLFYERAAGAGDRWAALRLGATFDAEFLGRLGFGKLQANPVEARSWYSRARDLGAVEAKRRLNSVETSTGNSLQ